MKKPVWRQNIGKGIPSDATGNTFTPNSVIPIYKSDDYILIPRLWEIDGFFDICAYETNRTKPAKYR